MLKKKNVRNMENYGIQFIVNADVKDHMIAALLAPICISMKNCANANVERNQSIVRSHTFIIQTNVDVHVQKAPAINVQHQKSTIHIHANVNVHIICRNLVKDAQLDKPGMNFPALANVQLLYHAKEKSLTRIHVNANVNHEPKYVQAKNNTVKIHANVNVRLACQWVDVKMV